MQPRRSRRYLADALLYGFDRRRAQLQLAGRALFMIAGHRAGVVPAAAILSVCGVGSVEVRRGQGAGQEKERSQYGLTAGTS